jgi:hypothetical protein
MAFGRNRGGPSSGPGKRNPLKRVGSFGPAGAAGKRPVMGTRSAVSRGRPGGSSRGLAGQLGRGGLAANVGRGPAGAKRTRSAPGMARAGAMGTKLRGALGAGGPRSGGRGLAAMRGRSMSAPSRGGRRR